MSELETVREAARQMRATADGADDFECFATESLPELSVGLDRHLTAWTPEVARKVADLLDQEATEEASTTVPASVAAVALAKTWLGVE